MSTVLLIKPLRSHLPSHQDRTEALCAGNSAVGLLPACACLLHQGLSSGLVSAVLQPLQQPCTVAILAVRLVLSIVYLPVQTSGGNGGALE